MIEFGQPLWFWAFALFPLLIALFFRNESQRKRLLQKLVAARLADNLAGVVSPTRRRIRFALMLLGFACVIVSLAQPRMGYTWQERKTRGRDVLIAVDVSRSMLANDLAPNRLTRAKLAAEDLITQLGGDRVGLIAFAGSAFLQAPLTADHSAVLNSLHELDPEIIPRGGTNIADAIRTAVEAFGKGESDNRALVIFTDGEELDTDGIKVAQEQKEIAKIFTVGIGSPEGTVIALPGRAGQTEYLKDSQGQIVKSRLDEERLRTIAQATGGFYLHLQNAPAQMRQLVSEGISSMSENEINAEVARQPIERYQWPLAAGMLLLLTSMFISERKKLSSRRKAPVAIAAMWMGMMLPTAGPLHAQSPAELSEQERYKEAQEAYEEMLRKNPDSDLLAFNHGAAAYKNRDFKTALEAFGKAVASEDPNLRARAEYNLGNTLFQQATSAKKEPDIKTLESALAHYDQARQLDAKDANAQHNYEVTKQLIEQLKQQQEQQQKEEQDKKEEEQDKKDQQEQQQSQGGKDDKDQKKEDQQQSKGNQQDKQKNQKYGDKNEQQQQGQGQQDKQQSESGKPNEQQQGEKGDQEKQDSEGAQKNPRDEKQKSENQQSKQQEGQGQEGEQSQQGNMPEQPDRKLEGDLKTDPVPGEDSKETQEQREMEEQELAAAEGRMTEAQAKALLDSLKSEDQRVRLWDPKGQRRERLLRDW